MTRDEGPGPTVFLVGCSPAGDSWRSLSGSPTYYGVTVSGAPTDEGLRFTAAALDGRCHVEWRSRERPSPLPRSAHEADLAHGESFVDGRAYLVYVEPQGARWEASAPPALSATCRGALAALRRLSSQELGAAAMRFLTLPRAWPWAHAEFVRATGFEQCRDGRIPAVRSCQVALGPLGAELAFEISVWHLGPDTWTPGAERVALARGVFGDDLVRLAECATVLRALRSCP